MQRESSPIANTKIKNDSQRPVSRFSSVTSATPAKRITFFKSGDVQFSGVRMAIHKRSFKCFDALLDDLSQKVPLPFGVRTITTPRGTHSIQRLEQLEDGGCYLCSDRRYVKPVDMEAAGRRPAVWHHSHPHSSRKKPTRPEEPPSAHSGQHYHRHPKRIVLVKNNDPTVRRSIILSRRTARSLRLFLDEISELMQCNVRKLYTLDGRKIDSVQSLMQCPNVLVCVGREPFKPLLLENLRKHSEEKLPRMGARSRSSVCSEGHESKKNVNFGLETKKSIIHPRSDSSNRSTRFSLSSDKSYPNGLCMTPGQMGCVSTCPYTKDVILNDDIEKRILVNKDGSLSVEMKVRFRLVNDETLQWSTEIKKSATTSNESSSVKDGDAHYLQGKAEYSNSESNSACEAEEGCAPKLRQKHLEESHCQNCCNHCQEYDIWKNPMHKDRGVNGARNSCSSSASSHHKIMHKKASVDSVRTISRSSEEYTEHVVEKASCFQQTVEEGDTRVEYCSISRCCSHSEISGTATKIKSKRPNEDTCKTNIINISHHSGIGDFGGFEIPKVTEDRPISAVSNSSKVLESLKEDQDDDYDDLPPSASRASNWSPSNSLEQEKQFTCVHCCGSQASQNVHLSPRPPSKVSSCSVHSPKHKKYRSMQTPDSARSSVSKVSSRSPSCQCGATTPGSAGSNAQCGLEEKIPIPVPEGSIVSNKSRARSNSSRAAESVVNGDQTECKDGRDRDHRCKSAMSANSGVSGKSGNSTACPCCGECERSGTAASRISENSQDKQAQEADKDAEVKSVGGRSNKSHRSEASAKSSKSERSHTCTPVTSHAQNVLENNEPVQNKPAGEDKVIQGRSESALSALSNLSSTSKQSNKSNRTPCGRASAVDSMISENDVVEDIEERTKSAMSAKSSASAKSKTNSVVPNNESIRPEETNQDERAISPMSAKSNRSSKCRSSQKSHCSNAERTIKPTCNHLDCLNKTHQEKDSERGESPISTASASHGQEPEPESAIFQEPRVESAMSLNSNSSSNHPSAMSTSGKSAKSQGKTVEKNVSPVPAKKDFDQEPGTTTKERAASAMSSTSKKSIKSNASSRNLQLVKKNAEPSRLSEAHNKAIQASDVESEDIPRIPSAMSAQEEQKSDCNIPGTAATSQPSHVTNPVIDNEKSQEESIASERPNSALSALSKNSKVSVKSDACSERTSRSKSVLKPAAQETEDTKDAQNSLIVRSPSPKKSKRAPSPNTPKSPIITRNNDRAPSELSVNSRASSKSARSNNNGSSTSNLKETGSKIPSDKASVGEKSNSARSPTPSPNPQSDEPLSPVSTVSLGLGEEAKSEDLSERPESSMSQILEENKTPVETSTPEPALDDNANSSEVIEPKKERPKTATSTSSAVSKNSKRSPFSQNLCKNDERSISPASLGKPESVKSTKSKAESTAKSGLDDGNHRVPSALSDKTSRPRENNLTIKKSKGTPQGVIKNSNSDNQLDKVSTISGSSSKCSQSKAASGKVTPTGNGQTTDKTTQKTKNISSSNLKIKDTKVASDCISNASSVKSLKMSKSDNKIGKTEEKTLPDVPQNCLEPALGTKVANKKVLPVIHLDSSSDSILSHTLSAAALLREKVGNARPVSRESGTVTSKKNCDLEEVVNTGSKCEKRSTSNQKRKISTSSETKNDEDQSLELVLSSLPSVSPTEVINDWLKNIPTEGPMYELEDEFDKQHKEHEAASQISSTNEEEEEDLQKETEEISENVTEMKESDETQVAAVDVADKEGSDTVCDETEASNETDVVKSETAAHNTDLSHLKLNKKLKELDLPRRCHSSVQVMKVLLSPKLDRCNSLPEVSPVYGRKLSTSAKRLLDCLANLQLIDSDPKNLNNEKYNEIISILQSLWIYEPNESEQEKHQTKKGGNCSAEDEFNPRSSSGVDVSSGSVGSGKGSFNGGLEESAPVIKQDALQTEDDIVKEGEDDPPCDTPESKEPLIVSSDPRTPDIAERVRCSPEEEKLEEEPQIDESSDDRTETDQAELSNKNSGNDSNDLKSAADNEPDPPENVGTSSSTHKGILTRRVSQDPDPVWVLSLLKKLEKQFMSHYASAMAEFKVKWDLDDNEMLDKMISELKDEVQKRIQSSINQELKKIQSRAGKAPRPPRNTLSRESTVQTEQRRRRLKVMKNQSISPSLSRSEDLNSPSGTDVSDQRSDDEYCPCEACMKKKMESRAVQRGEALSLAPVMREFDLRKILQTKKDPPVTKSKVEEPSHSDIQGHNNLDVVHEEESEVQNDGKNPTNEDKEPEGEAQKTSKEEAEEGLSDDEEEEKSEGQAIEEGEAEEERKEEAEEEGSVKGEQDIEDKEEEAENREVSEAVDEAVKEEAENAEDQEAANEEDPPEEDDPPEETEDQETPKEEEQETGEEAEVPEEEDAEETEEKIGGAEEGEKMKDGEETGEESGEIDNAVEAEPSTNDVAETTEGDEIDEVDTTTNENEGETPNEDDGDQDASTQAEVDAKDDTDENQGITEEEKVEQAEVEDCGTEENDTKAKSTEEAENQKEDPELSSEKEGSIGQLNSNGIEDNASEQASDKDSGYRLTKQLTKTSLESQPGSMENATEQKVQTKLKDIRSFMQSSESQDDSIVVITKQSPFTERRSVSSRRVNKEEVESEVIEWQVSPKRRNRSPARAIKQRRPKDNDD